MDIMACFKGYEGAWITILWNPAIPNEFQPSRFTVFRFSSASSKPLAMAFGSLQERDLGQKFVVDATLAADLSKAGLSDNLSDTIDYASVYE